MEKEYLAFTFILRYHNYSKQNLPMSMERIRERCVIMDEKAKEARRTYMREWRSRNKDKVREANRRYWERRAEKLAEEGKGADA